MNIPAPDFAVTPYGEVDATALKALRETFDTTALLILVDQLEPLRQRLGAGGGVRDALLWLHSMAHTVVNGANFAGSSGNQDVWELAQELGEELRGYARLLAEAAEKLEPLSDLRPQRE